MEIYYDDRQDDITITDEIKNLIEKSIATVAISLNSSSIACVKRR